MKITKTARMAALLLAGLLLISCGAATDKAESPQAMPAPSSAPAAVAPSIGMAGGGKTADYAAEQAIRDEGGAGPAPAPADADRKVVKNGWMQLETKAFDDDLAAILALIAQSGGYIERQSVSGASLSYRGTYYERTASVGARIPADKLDAVTAGVAGICNVVSREQGASDITDRYYDAEARLKSLTLQEERLLEILSKAEKLEDVISLEQALSNVRYEIEALTASLRRMDAQVSYSTLNLELREVAEYKTVTEKPKTLGERIADAWNRALETIGDSFEGALLFVIGDLPVLLVWLAVALLLAWAAWRIWKRARIRRPSRRQPPAPPQKDPEEGDSR